MVKKTLIALLLFWLALLIFMPKVQLYYLLEQALEKQEIRINEAKIDENLFGLGVTDATLFYKGIPVAKVAKTEMLTLLVYNRVKIEHVILDALLKEKFPASVEHLGVRYSVLDPLHVQLSGSGSFGTFEGAYNLRTRKLHIDIVPGKEIGTIQQWLKQGEKGYYYETSF